MRASFFPLLILILVVSGCTQKHVVYQPTTTELFALDPATSSFYNNWQGVPYLLGGKSKKGIDCSALMQEAYWVLYGKQLPRTTLKQMRLGYQIPFIQLQKGDLLFFKTGWRTYHVGMYLGSGRFLHAGEHSGVKVSSLLGQNSAEAVYWRRHFLGARRL